ncbi:inositol oxygenase-like [Clytia hemisphaerica]|uniref:Inositol oxygenase n=1 Tax=Clytia hemisphaerica TaxID=252671 RepID=A0A7M5WLV6_9CNID
MRVLIPKLDTATIGDPSESYRPEKISRTKKTKEQFRNYDENLQTDMVKKTYLLMHEKQCVQFVKKMHEKWCEFNHAEMTMMEAIMLLDNLVDESDPDTDLPNSIHAFQTAERIREKYPDDDWLHLTGLIHDAGKVMALWGEPQWAVVGDTFPIGCRFQEECVFHRFFEMNPDYNNSNYNTKNGIYKEHCGLDNVTMSWGHDEYMYRLLKFNKTSLPEEALYRIRYHSFYPFHGSDAYMNLCDEKDIKWQEKLKEFSTFDLYSKAESIPDVKALTPYYQSLIDKYIPGVLKW